MRMSPVVHFEMPAEDRRRMASFYENAFGWKTQMLGPDMGDYVLVTTAESDVKPGAPAGANQVRCGDQPAIACLTAPP